MTGLMLAERHISGTIDMKMAESHVLGTIGLMLAERHVSGTIDMKMAESHVLGTIGLMLAERHVSSTIDMKMTESHASCMIGRMMAERHILGMTRLMLLKSVHREHPPVCHTWPARTRRMSSSGLSSVRVIPSASSEGIRSESRATSVSGLSHSGIPSPEDARSRKDLEISILVDALEAGLRFPLHPTIVECLRWWRISPSQIAPNSWCYLIVFLSEYRGVGIVPSRTLFFACFRLCKSRGGYYLTARAGFMVSGAPTNSPSWGFRADWSIHPISNVPPLLSEEEFVAINRLRGILPLSRGIRDMTEKWLVEAGLSLASRGAMDRNVLRKKPRMLGGKGAPVADPENAQPEVKVMHEEALGKRPAGSLAPDPTATG
ncbi:hypothetical protein BHE74_00006270 [Ensete ventricosum]|nr:hypothetical protein BHE74_00006270 [Ensete ventricosum]